MRTLTISRPVCREALDCARPLALLPRTRQRTQSGRGLPHSKTLAQSSCACVRRHPPCRAETRRGAVLRANGFTLLELLIAVVVFSIVLASINAIFYGALRLRNKTAQSLDEAWSVQSALTIIQRDLANIVAPGGTLSGTLQTSRTGGQNSTTPTTANAGAINQPGQSSPEFHTATGLLDDLSPWAEVQKVSYQLIPSTNGAYGKDLFRSVTRNLLPSLQDQPVLTPLLSGVESIFFFFHDGTQWRDEWDSTSTTASLPKAIKVQIGRAREARPGGPVLPNERAESLLELVVPVWVGSASNATEQATGGTP